MSLKVEMFWGKPDRMEIMGLDTEGELYVQDIIPLGEPNPDFRIFDCPYYVWDWIIKLGEIMGWNPMGTVMEKTIDSNEPIISDYKPNTWRDDDFKIFLAEDAKGLAGSLEKAIKLLEPQSNVSGLMTSSMNEKDEIIKLINHLTIPQLRNFIIFLRKGKFKFVYDD